MVRLSKWEKPEIDDLERKTKVGGKEVCPDNKSRFTPKKHE